MFRRDARRQLRDEYTDPAPLGTIQFPDACTHIFTQNIYAGDRCVTMRAVGWWRATSE